MQDDRLDTLKTIGASTAGSAEGLGNDAGATARMWRTIIDPNKPL
jgi:hypothetical protein